MKNSLKEALQSVQMVYDQLIEIGDRLVAPYTQEIDDIIDSTMKKIENLTNDDIRNTLLLLSLKAYTLGEIKEKSALKFACAETIKDEVYARKYNETDGPVKTRENVALLDSNYEILSQAVFDEIYSMLKTKSDEIHRVVDSLKNILISRACEAKALNNSVIGDIE